MESWGADVDAWAVERSDIAPSSGESLGIANRLAVLRENRLLKSIPVSDGWSNCCVENSGKLLGVLGIEWVALSRRNKHLELRIVRGERLGIASFWSELCISRLGFGLRNLARRMRPLSELQQGLRLEVDLLSGG